MNALNLSSGWEALESDPSSLTEEQFLKMRRDSYWRSSKCCSTRVKASECKLNASTILWIKSRKKKLITSRHIMQWSIPEIFSKLQQVIHTQLSPHLSPHLPEINRSSITITFFCSGDHRLFHYKNFLHHFSLWKGHKKSLVLAV